VPVHDQGAEQGRDHRVGAANRARNRGNCALGDCPPGPSDEGPSATDEGSSATTRAGQDPRPAVERTRLGGGSSPFWLPLPSDTLAAPMWRRAAGFGLFATLIALASLFACRQLVGITDNPPEDLTSTFCGLPYGTSACASCVQASCCTESTTCAADPACAAYEGCLGQCNGDLACRS
jgi:hypothetical protein